MVTPKCVRNIILLSYSSFFSAVSWVLTPQLGNLPSAGDGWRRLVQKESADDSICFASFEGVTAPLLADLQTHRT